MPTTLTKRAIKESFVNLLNERPLNKISVRDITDKCGINRNSFYYHYQDIPALMEEILIEQIDDIIEKYSGTDSLDEFFDVSFGFVLENKRALYHMYCSSNREYFEQMLMKTCEYIVTNYMGRLFKEAENINKALYKKERKRPVCIVTTYTGLQVKVKVKKLRELFIC